MTKMRRQSWQKPEQLLESALRRWTKQSGARWEQGRCRGGIRCRGDDAVPAAPLIYAIEEQKRKSESNRSNTKKESNGDNLLRVSCPDCGASGKIPLGPARTHPNFASVFATLHRIRKSGEIVSICQNASGKWIEAFGSTSRRASVTSQSLEHVGGRRGSLGGRLSCQQNAQSR